MRTRQELPVSIEVCRDDKRTLREQLVGGFIDAIDSGLLRPGERLPSTRTVAEGLGVSRGVAIVAYELLLARGYITGKPRAGTYVAGRADLQGRLSAAPVADARVIDLRPGHGAPKGFPIAAWRSAWRQASHMLPRSPAPSLGVDRLRQVVHRRVALSRGHLAGYETAICGTLGDALRVVLDALAPGVPIAAAQPIPSPLRQALLFAGRTLLPFSNGEDLIADDIPRQAGAVVVLSETHYLSSRATSKTWRRELSRWHDRTGGAVIEVNLEGAARPTTTRVPSLLAEVPSPHAGLVGDFTTLLTPEMPLAYLVVPSAMSPLVESRIVSSGLRPPVLHQDVLLRLLTNGTVQRRSTGLARLHQRRTDLVREAFERLPVRSVTSPAFDGATAVRLPPSLPAARVAMHARRRGVQVACIADFHLSLLPQAADNGLVLDLTYLDEAAARGALRVLTRLCRELLMLSNDLGDPAGDETSGMMCG
ncbi:GntR family transcriptional regulator [Streptosporangium sp. OZ121]|uniref:GntR family transcriptional regulator n=1 Tax=Streptosporangium sp. OZ121 TaxID=3444183 RepID=UPI003F7A4B8A